MIVTKMVWTKENVRDFVAYYTIKRTKTQKVLLLSYLICAVFVFVFGLTVFIMLREAAVLLISMGAFALMVVYLLFFYIMMRGMTKKLIAANEENNQLEVCFNSDVIFIRKDDAPFGMIEWENIAEIHIAKTAAYLMSKENALILTEYDRIIAGSKEEFIELLKNKNEHIEKNKNGK